jgi:hypothetical protein
MEYTREPYAPTPPRGWGRRMIKTILEARYEEGLSYKELVIYTREFYEAEEEIELKGLTIAWVAYVCWRYQKQFLRWRPEEL